MILTTNISFAEKIVYAGYLKPVRYYTLRECLKDVLIGKHVGKHFKHADTRIICIRTL